MYGLPLWKYLPVYCSPVFTSLVRHKDTLFEIIGNIVDESLADMNAAEGEEEEKENRTESNALVLAKEEHQQGVDIALGVAEIAALAILIICNFTAIR